MHLTFDKPHRQVTISSVRETAMTLDLDLPSQRALLALSLAGFNVTLVGPEFLTADPNDGLDLTFERDDGSLFTLSHDAQNARFEIEECLGELPEVLGDLALMMNACLAPQRRIARDPSTRRLMVSSVLSWDEADVGRLAEEITAVAEIAQALREAKPLESMEPMRPETLGLRA